MTTRDETVSFHTSDAVQRAVGVAGVVWFALAMGAGATGAMRFAPAWVIPLFVVGVNLALVGLYRRHEGFRGYVTALGWRALALPHALRAPIGAGFLVMCARGIMPVSLALHAGLGDIAAGLGVVAIAALPMRDDTRWRWLRAWNVFGLVDIVTVVMDFQRVLLIDHHPQLTARMPWLPFPLLPFFVVPVVVASHLALIPTVRRLRS